MIITAYLKQAILTCCITLISMTVYAQGVSSTQADGTAGPLDSGLSLSQALARSLRDSPRLAAFPYHRRAAEARQLQAGLRPNPELALEIENIAGSGGFSGIDGGEFSISLRQVLELGGKRNKRVALASYGRELIESDYEIARLDVLAEATHQFIQAARAQAGLMLAQRRVGLAQRAYAGVEARVVAGRASRAERHQARIENIQSELAVKGARRSLASARVKLAAGWGEERPDFDTVAADLYALPTLPEFDVLAQRLDNNPRLARYLTLERLQRAQLTLARAEGRQNIEIGVGYRRLQGQGDNAFLFEVSMPLGISNRNQGGIAGARARMEQVAIEQQASRTELYAALFGFYQQMQQAREQLQALHGSALVEADKALQVTEQGYRAGRFSYLELVAVGKQRLEVELAVIDAAAAFHRTRIEIERLTGMPLIDGVTTGTTIGQQD